MDNRITFIIGFLLVVILSVLLASYASGHQAPSGMKYPPECCHDLDCAPVDNAARTNPTDGSLPQLIVTTKHGTVAVPHDFDVRMSEDNLMHACIRKLPNGQMKLICFFVPPTG